VGTVVLAGATWVDPALAVGAFLGGVLAGPLVLCCSTRGRIDPGTATVESGPRGWDLSRVTGYTAWRVGPLTVVSESDGTDAVLFAGGGVAAALFAGAVGWYAAAIGLLFAAVFLLVAREG
jgi:hypothetical protein